MENINQNGQLIEPKPGVHAVETRLLADYIGRSDKDLLTYDELSRVINRNVQGSGRRYLLTARRIVLKEKDLVFRPVKNIGIRRLNSIEIAKLEDREQHIRRTAKISLRERRAVDITSLPELERASCVGKMALAAMTIHSHSPKQMKALESAATGRRQLDLAETLNAFK